MIITYNEVVKAATEIEAMKLTELQSISEVNHDQNNYCCFNAFYMNAQCTSLYISYH